MSGPTSHLDEAHLVDVLEALYAVDRSDEEWLTQTLFAFSHVCGAGLEPSGFFYDASNVADLKVHCRCSLKGTPPELSKVWSLFESLVNPEFVRATFRSLLVGSGRTTAIKYVRPIVDERARQGHGDFFYVNALDPSGIGCVLSFNSRDSDFELGVQDTALLRRIATHVSAAYRLRRRLTLAPVAGQDATASAPRHLDTAEAVLDDRGRILHAKGLARSKDAHDELQDAAAAIDAARAPAERRNGIQAIEGWHPLTRARWTLVDTFEEGGRRYVLACENQVAAADFSALTDRERQVVVHAGFGMRSKEIGYALGISEATVRVLLSRAARRLGVRSRDELLAHPSLRALRAAVDEGAAESGERARAEPGAEPPSAVRPRTVNNAVVAAREAARTGRDRH